MSKLSYFFLMALVSVAILVDIFFVGRMIDALTLVVLFSMVLFVRKSEEIKNIYFFSAAGCLVFAIILYYLITSHPYFDVAANWTYAFLLAGVVTMVVQQFKNETHK